MLFNWFSKRKQAEKTLNDLQQRPPNYVEKIESQTHILCVADVKSGQDLIGILEAERIILNRILTCITESNNAEEIHKNSLAQCEAELKTLRQNQIKCKRSIDSIIASHSQILNTINVGLYVPFHHYTNQQEANN